jgi:hypothetical protein
MIGKPFGQATGQATRLGNLRKRHGEITHELRRNPKRRQAHNEGRTSRRWANVVGAFGRYRAAGFILSQVPVKQAS